MNAYSKDNIPEALIQAAKYISEEKLKKAEPILRNYLMEYPMDVNAMKLLADIGVKFRAYKDAGYLLTCLDLSPEYDPARLSYANLLYKRQLPFEALKHINILLEKEPNNNQYLTQGSKFSLSKSTRSGFNNLRKNIKDHGVKNNQLHLSYGHTLRAVGRLDEAIDSYKSAISSKTGYGEAYWSLANLKTYKFTDNDMKNLHALLNDEDCKIDDYFHLPFALGKAEEDAKNFESAMAAYTKGNTIKSKQVPWDSKLYK